LEKIKLTANVRTDTGNGPARVLRRDGKIPAVLYGPDTKPILLSIQIHDFELLLKDYNVSQMVLDLDVKNGKTIKKSVMVKELQTHPVSHTLLHIDFYEISMTRKIKVNVPIVTTGKSAGEELGGVVQIIRRELEVLCLPGEIPESITVDISELEIGDSLHVEDITLGGDIEISAEVNFTVLTVTSPKVEVEEEEEIEEEEGEEIEGEEAASEEPEAE
jgi:large subunit ribosomal protein L25